MNIPSTITAGDTIAWTDSLADYPATTWTLKYSLWKYGQAVIGITASASGSDHAVSVAPAVSTAYAAGDWQWTAYVEKGSGGTLERYTVATGRVTIKPNVAAASSSADFRSHAEKMLTGIEATLQGRATRAEMSLTINGKAIQYLKPDELERWRSIYRRVVSKEKGESSIVGIQFGSA